MFHELTENMKISLIEWARRNYDATLEYEAKIRAEHNAYWEKKREATRAAGLRKLEAKYIDTLEYWEKRNERCMSAQAVSDALTKIDGKGRKVEFLKGQIKIRTVGLGWTDLKVAWSKGGVNKEPEELERDLGEILEEEKDREMPPDAPVPSIARKTLKQLGAPIQQFDELRAAVAVEQRAFEDGVAAERDRRDAARETDKFQRQQPLVAPAVDSLVGKRIEYLRWVGFPDGGEAKHWFAGLVEQVSDGTVRKGPRAKACHQAGFARILWDAQPALGEHEPTESWVALRPNKFNGDAKCCWRLDLD